MTTLVLGPVRSGKSARAQTLAQASGKRVVLAATAALDPRDAEMRDRVARHRKDRPRGWSVIETAASDGPTLVALLESAEPQTCVVVDALGTWFGALLQEWAGWAERDLVATLAALDAEGAALVEAVARARADVVLVAEETGWGVVPPSGLGRIFRDALGRLTARLAARVDRAELVVAGYALDLRALGTPVGEV